MPNCIFRLFALITAALTLSLCVQINAQFKVEPITTGPGFHWFGYYDKFQFDPTDRFVLGMQVDFEHRAVTKDDVVTIGMIDLQDGNRWINLGKSQAWCWQQGCMLQWRPGSDNEVIWNDREDDRFVCRILNVESREIRTLPHPIYHISPDGKFALGTDFARINDQRPGYGYAGIGDPYKNENAPAQSGIYTMNLDTGVRKDIISLADIERVRFDGQPAPGKLHFNHIQWSPDGKRFIFFSRMDGNKHTRSYTARPDGSDIRLLGTDSSHFQWRDPKHVLIWSEGAYRLHKDDGSGNSTIVLEAENGHNSYLPGNDWIVTDTYPKGNKREQLVYLYQCSSEKKIELGRFTSPEKYKGQWRCDTHPRISRDGMKIVIDSPHGGNGRQMYLIDVSNVVGKKNIGEQK
jgi:hypothetical protein